MEKISDLTANDDIPLKSYDHCMTQVVCNPSQPAYYLGICGLCPKISGLKEHLNSLMDDCRRVLNHLSSHENTVNPQGRIQDFLQGGQCSPCEVQQQLKFTLRCLPLIGFNHTVITLGLLWYQTNCVRHLPGSWSRFPH